MDLSSHYSMGMVKKREEESKDLGVYVWSQKENENVRDEYVAKGF